MAAEQVDAIVIGAGLAGSAAAWAMTRRGRSVAVLEAFGPGHRRGSSHGSARVFRRAYSDPLYVRLTGDADRLWRALADEAGEELLLRAGGLDYGPEPNAEKMYDILRAYGVTAELLPAGAAGERWPGLAFGPDPVMFHPDAGVLDPERVMTAMCRLAATAGAQIFYETAVVRVSATADGAVVDTAGHSWRAPVVIVAAGPWLEPLLGGLVRLPPLTVRQVEAFHFAPLTPAWSGPAPAPIFIYHDQTPFYGLLAGRDGEVPGAVKIGGHDHGHGTVTTGDARDGIVNPVVREQVRAFVRDRVPGLDPAPVGELTCMYTLTANEDFILDRQGPFVICSACSGHGAKFAPLTGEIAADLACGGVSPDHRFTLAAHVR
jgi:monomeric sarcosine oxidase